MADTQSKDTKDRTPRRAFVIDVLEPDYRTHKPGKDMDKHCYRCGRAIAGETGCTIRLESTDGTVGDMLNAWVEAAPGQYYYPVGPECVKRVPAEFRMDPRNVGPVLSASEPDALCRFSRIWVNGGAPCGKPESDSVHDKTNGEAWHQFNAAPICANCDETPCKCPANRTEATLRGLPSTEAAIAHATNFEAFAMRLGHVPDDDPKIGEMIAMKAEIERLRAANAKLWDNVVHLAAHHANEHRTCDHTVDGKDHA